LWDKGNDWRIVSAGAVPAETFIKIRAICPDFPVRENGAAQTYTFQALARFPRKQNDKNRFCDAAVREEVSNLVRRWGVCLHGIGNRLDGSGVRDRVQSFRTGMAAASSRTGCIGSSPGPGPRCELRSRHLIHLYQSRSRCHHAPKIAVIINA
jgi:hypothetical protein